MTVRDGDRGQIQFDFAVGVSILVVMTILAFSFVPSIFGGVTTEGTQSDQVVADRIATTLVEERLSVPGSSSDLEIECVLSLFTTSNNHCGFDSGSVADHIPLSNPVPDDRFVHVEVIGNPDPTVGDGKTQLYWDSSTGPLTESPGGTELSGGNNVGTSNPQGTATRAVSIDDTPATIVVRVW